MRELLARPWFVKFKPVIFSFFSYNNDLLPTELIRYLITNGYLLTLPHAKMKNQFFIMRSILCGLEGESLRENLEITRTIAKPVINEVNQ